MLRTIVLLLVFVQLLCTGMSLGAATSGDVVLNNGDLNENAKLKTGIDTLVLSPKKFHRSLIRWLDYRIAQGHEIAVLTPARFGYRDQAADSRGCQKPVR